MPIDCNEPYATEETGPTMLRDGFVENNAELAICACINMWNTERCYPIVRGLIHWNIMVRQMEALARRLDKKLFLETKRQVLGED